MSKIQGYTGYSKRMGISADGSMIPVCELCGNECIYDVVGVQIVCSDCWEDYPERRSGESPMYRIQVPSGKYTGKKKRMKRIPTVGLSFLGDAWEYRGGKMIPRERPVIEERPTRRKRTRSVTEPRARVDHSQCSHGSSSRERRACRAGRGL